MTKNKFFYGWTIVGVSFAVQGIGLGSQYVVLLLIQPFREIFHASAAAVFFSTASVMMLCSGLLSPLAGWLVQRYSLRPFLLLSPLLTGGGYLALHYASRIWHVAVIFGLFFSAATVLASIAGNTLVSNWFNVRRGRALGVALSGVALAACLLPLTTAYFIGKYGLADTFLILAGISIAIVPFVYWLAVDKPESMGLSPDGEVTKASEPQRGASDANVRWTLAELARSRRFWIFAAVVGICVGASAVLPMVLIPAAQSAGIGMQSAAYLVSYYGISTVPATLLFGKLCDSLGQRVVMWLVIALFAVGCALILGHPGYPAFVVASVLFGLGGGAAYVVPGALIAVNFGSESFALVFGALNPFLTLVVAGSLTLVGRAYDVYGSYDAALVGALIVFAAIAAGTGLLPESRRAKLVALSH